MACELTMSSTPTNLAPRMSQELIDRVSLLWIDVEQMCDQILGCSQRQVSVPYVNVLETGTDKMRKCRPTTEKETCSILVRPFQ